MAQKTSEHRATPATYHQRPPKYVSARSPVTANLGTLVKKIISKEDLQSCF